MNLVIKQRFPQSMMKKRQINDEETHANDEETHTNDEETTNQ